MPTIHEQQPKLEKLKRELEAGGEMSAVGVFTAAATEVGGDGTSWIEVMPAVTEAKNGPYFFTITKEDLGLLVADIEAHPDKISIDYDHAGAEKGDTRAAGWYTGEAQVVLAGEKTPRGDTAEQDSVWAKVKWTPKAVQEIRDGEFRFVSAEWSMETKDSKSGLWTKFEELAASTLTNRPFFKDLAPVTAKEYASAVAELVVAVEDDDTVHLREAVDAFLAADNAPYGDVEYADPGYQKDGQKRYPLDTETHIRAAWSYINQEGNAAKYSPENLAKVKAKIRAAMKRIGADVADSSGGKPSAIDQGDDDETKENIVAEEQPVTDYLKALGLPADADPKHKLATAFRDKDEKILALTQEITELTAASIEKDGKASELASRVAELESKDRARDIDVILARAVEKGRVLPAEKETLAEIFAADVDGLRKMIATRPAEMFALEAKGTGGGDTDRFVDDPDVAQFVKGMNTGGDPVDTEQAKQHLMALDILREQGKAETYTNDEYVAAYNKAAPLVY